MNRGLSFLLLAAVPACARPPRATEYPAAPPPVETAASAAPAPAAAPPPRRVSDAAKRILVTPEDSLDRKLDVLAVLDFHTRAESQDKGFDELREKAATLGADAVVGAQFEHGEGNEPSHLSGMAVRYGKEDARAVEILGNIDIATPEDDDDKGFDRMRAQARKMGADEIREIEFDHGAEGGQSHLKGVAVRHRPL